MMLEWCLNDAWTKFEQRLSLAGYNCTCFKTRRINWATFFTPFETIILQIMLHKAQFKSGSSLSRAWFKHGFTKLELNLKIDIKNESPCSSFPSFKRKIGHCYLSFHLVELHHPNFWKKRDGLCFLYANCVWRRWM